jgi:hypothetical protein
VFLRHGWTTQEVWWPERPPQREGQDLHLWFTRLRCFVHAHMGQILSVEVAPKIALVGKSMGAFAAALAADRRLPAIWLTPVLDHGMETAGDPVNSADILRRTTVAMDEFVARL